MIDRQENAWQGLHWELPPLILHPFDRGRDCSWALGSIRLSLLLSGLADAGLEKEPLLRARFLEFRMLCLIGKDVMRWLAQCDDFAARDQALASSGICPQSFADLLINRTPPEVAGRFESWAVSDFRRILSRAIGINAVFPEPPGYASISPGFLEEYYAYADSLFNCYLGVADFARLPTASFRFALYTSDEYLATLGYVPDEPSK